MPMKTTNRPRADEQAEMKARACAARLFQLERC